MKKNEKKSQQNVNISHKLSSRMLEAEMQKSQEINLLSERDELSGSKYTEEE